jgi:hypothetical protein
MARREPDSDRPLPTVLTALAAHCEVHVICDCERVAELDLRALADRGLGHVALIELPLRCQVCGSVSGKVSVSGRRYHPG